MKKNHFATIVLSAVASIALQGIAFAQYENEGIPPGRQLVEQQQQQFEQDLEHQNESARQRVQRRQLPHQKDLIRTKAARAYKGKYDLKPDEYAALTPDDLENYQEDVQYSDLNGSSITQTSRWAKIEVLDVRPSKVGGRKFRVRVPKGKTAFWVFESALVLPASHK